MGKADFLMSFSPFGRVAHGGTNAAVANGSGPSRRCPPLDLDFPSDEHILLPHAHTVVRRIWMLRTLVRLVPAALAWMLAAMPLAAHHAVATKFDPAKPNTLNGLVTHVDWANPHVHILMNVVSGGRTVNWAVEIESPLDLERSGWNAASVKPGDAVTVQGLLARDGSPQVWANSIVLREANQRVLTISADAAATRAKDNRPSPPAPRWPDGKPRLGAAPGETGYWGRPSSTVLMQTGANVAMDSSGLLKNLKDAGKVAPFQPWALGLYELRQRTFLSSDPMYLNCIPPGAVRQFQMPYGNQFLEDKTFGRIFLMAGGGNHDWHFIYTDGRPQEGELGGNDTNPLYYGNARGRWEGDTFVVDTRSFNEKFWFTNGGLPHTEQLHLVERFTRTDMNTLQYEVTLDDPGAYTRPWSASWTLQWVAGEELPVYYCQDNRP
jgi:hypothetical protein